MPEPIRLVIWDLDQTFWSGTLTEGGITHRPQAHQIVIELARRGIISSICSKNDLASVRKQLRLVDLWDFFVFPSIDWQPKGARIAAQIAAIGLRPASVLFVDDNPANLAEALARLPDLQTAPDSFIDGMLDDPRLTGKPDPELRRLLQYRTLQERQADAASAPADSTDFLRASGIVVRLEHDLDRHIDRAVELINRTNQLNFTKHRLSEDLPTARGQLRKMLSGYDRHFGIIQVADKYGDHGYCGLYVLQHSAGGGRLLHFCFSCRILNMGVETWLFRHLGCPELSIRGEVLSDPSTAQGPVDWITLERADSFASRQEAAPAFDYIYARGGCELQAVTHYFRNMAAQEFLDVNLVRDDRPIRLDHSMFIRHAEHLVPGPAMADLRAVGFEPDDFRPQLLKLPGAARALWVLSFWADAANPLYRHIETGVHVPVRLRRTAPKTPSHNLAHLSPQDVPGDEALIETARRAFRFAGGTQEAAFIENLEMLFRRLPPGGRAFVLLANEANSPGSEQRAENQFTRLNRWTRQAAAAFPGVTLLDIADFILRPEEVENVLHFHREVYFRVFRYIVAAINAEEGKPSFFEKKDQKTFAS